MKYEIQKKIFLTRFNKHNIFFSLNVLICVYEKESLLQPHPRKKLVHITFIGFFVHIIYENSLRVGIVYTRTSSMSQNNVRKKLYKQFDTLWQALPQGVLSMLKVLTSQPAVFMLVHSSQVSFLCVPTILSDKLV